MELYELKPDTLQIVDSLRAIGSGGPFNYMRASGKTTALMIRAKELLDSGVDVIYAYRDTRWAMNVWRDMFPHAVNSPLFINRPNHSRSIPASVHVSLLVDEPTLLNWLPSEWNELRARFKVEVVGL